MATKAKTIYPFTVRTVEGDIYVKGFETLGEASVNAAYRNTQAVDLKIKTRYVASDTPSPAE